MSSQDGHDDSPDKHSTVDELENADASGDAQQATEPETPQKRGRGRPKGSKNKKGADAPGPSEPVIPKKRGRPPKEKKPEDLAAADAPKKKRGRPPKNPKPEGEASGDGEPSPKKKRGRPPKSTTTTTAT